MGQIGVSKARHIRYTHVIGNFMKRHTNILTLVLTIGLFACNNVSDKTSKKEQQFDCNSLTDKKVIFEIAKSIIEKKDNEQIWNISEIDTTDFFTTEDYFTNSKTKNKLVLIGGNAGMSSGTADNLLILFSCSDTLNILWSGQVGDFNQTDIIDLNGDGVKEMVCNSSMMWMGECNDNYNIFNFKDGIQNFVFTSHSTTVLDCGRDNLGELYKLGDTLETNLGCSLIKLNDKEFSVRQIKTTKIHNGGQTDEEIMKNLKVIIDTTTIKLK